MKSSFEWKNDIEEKVENRRCAIAERNSRIRRGVSISCCAALCLVCGITVSRVVKVSPPTVQTDTTNESADLINIQTTVDCVIGTGGGYDYAATARVDTPPSDSGLMHPIETGTDIPCYSGDDAEQPTELPSFTAAVLPDIDVEYPQTTGNDLVSQPSYTGYDPYATTLEIPQTEKTEVAVDGFRFIEPIISQAFPAPKNYQNSVPYLKTFEMALDYLGLTEKNVPSSFNVWTDYTLEVRDKYEFLVLDDSFGMVVRDTVTVQYLSKETESYFELSMGKVTAPYDWVFAVGDGGTLEYKGVEVRCGYLNADGISAELIVADFEFGGVIYRFTGHDAVEKEFLHCLYIVIDYLFR